MEAQDVWRMGAPMKIKDLTGKRFGRLEARSPLHRRDRKNRAMIDWRCMCDCGNECIIAGSALRAGLTRSCGCLANESRRAVKHGGAGTRLYNAWLNMRVRCGDPTYLNYCGRGVRVCQRWQNSFEAFRDDVGDPPSPRHSLDRFPDNDGNYEPGNVRWATAKQQGRNKRDTIFIEVGGERLSLADASDKFGIPYDTLHNRIRAGWPHDQAVSLPSSRRKFDGSIVIASRER